MTAARTPQQTQWTPLPWTITHGPDGGWQISAAHYAVICDREPWTHRAAESRANGNLLMAAPEMAELLADIISRVPNTDAAAVRVLAQLQANARALLARIGAA